MMASLPVQVVWHMAVSHLEDSLMRTMGEHPLRHGTVYIAGGWKQFYNEMLQRCRTWNTDKSGWDWNSPGWPYWCCKQLRINLTEGKTEKWIEVMNWLYKDAFETKCVLLPDGRVLQQKEPGLMPSGCVITITDNGFAQLFVDLNAVDLTGQPYTYPVATGDDVAQQRPRNEQEYIRALEVSGCKIKEVSEGVEFMGFELTSQGFFPKYLQKHVMNLMYQKQQFVKETLDSYLRIYVYDEQLFNFWKEVAYKMGFSPPDFLSRSYYLYFAGNPNAREGWTEPKTLLFADALHDEAITDFY